MMLIVNIFLLTILIGGSSQQEMDSDSDSATTMGKDYFFGIPLLPQSLSPHVVLIVGTPSGAATFAVEIFSRRISEFTVTSGAPFRIRINPRFEVTSNEFQNRRKGISIVRTGDSPIYVVITVSFPRFLPFGYASFPIHPSYNFSRRGIYEYYALSSDSDGSTNHFSNILLVGNYDNTTVSVTPTQNVSIPENAHNNSSLLEVTAGSTHTITVGRLETLLIFSTRDLTGTKIVSDKPVTVISGHQCAQIPAEASFCEPLYVHLPPTINWGQSFLLAPFARRSSQIYKLVTSMASTDIFYRCGTNESEGTAISAAGTGFSIAPRTISNCYLTASKPIFLVQFATGNSVDKLGDPAVAVVAPTSGYIKHASFTTLPSAFTFVTVIVQAEHFNRSHILINGTELMCEPSWTDILDFLNTVVGRVCTQSISTGSHSIAYVGENGTFSAVVYGWDNSPARGYAYLTGFNITKGLTKGLTDDFEEDLKYMDLSGLRVEVLRREEDSNSEPISIPGSMLFGKDLVTTVYVSENGIFSFGEPWNFSHPDVFPTSNFYIKERNVLAPFWSDNDIRREGTVRCAAIEKGSSRNGDLIMHDTAVYINDHFVSNDEQPFEPTWVLVAQWEKVHPYPHGASNHEGLDEKYLNKTNTYQGVIATDTIRSYYAFSFPCGEMEWSGQGLETSIIGYNSRDYRFRNHPANGLSDIGQIVSCTRNIRSEKRKRKKRSDNNFELDFDDFETGRMMPCDNETSQAIMKCKNFAETDRELIPDIMRLKDMDGNIVDVVSDVLPHCPPTKELMMLNTAFVKFNEREGDNCHQSRDSFSPDVGRHESYKFVSVCCYDNNGAPITTGLQAGRLTDITTYSNTIKDIYFKEACCTESYTNCTLYTSLRPPIPIAPPDVTKCAAGWGDPHYSSFDGAIYSFFNGDNVDKHNYMVMNVSLGNGQNFELQAVILNFSTISLAFGIRHHYVYQFVEGNEPVLYKTFPDEELITSEVDNDDVHITYDNNCHYDYTCCFAFFKKLRLEINMTYRQGRISLINYYVYAPTSVCINSVGHLGNCDENGTNDVLENNYYEVANEDSLFLRTVREKRQTNFECCGNTTLVAPRFEDLNFTEDQRSFCENDNTCLYDLVVTGDKNLAENSKKASKTSTRLQALIRNYSPNITSDGVFHVNVGEENIYFFTVMDTNNFTVRVDGEMPAGGVLFDEGDGTFLFKWIPTSVPTKEVSFTAVDELGAATVHTPFVQVCACFNGGECTSMGVSSTTSHIQNLNCHCTEAYSGDTCSEDRNGCAEIECFKGVECFDVPAPGVGAVCGPCTTGFTGDGLKCTDLDECTQDGSLCDQTCNNTFGSYVCSCDDGYTLKDGVCEDNDECSGVNDCQQNCINTEGSFLCACEQAFELDANGKTCNPQTTCGVNSCSHICAVIEGQDICFCPVGLRLALDSSTDCEDVNECSHFSPCDQICTNTNGSYECSCESGFLLQDDTGKCRDIDECHIAALESTVICTGENTQCVNTNGSFECACVSGYELEYGTCERLDEVEPPRKVIVPDLAKQNSLVFVVETYTINDLTVEIFQHFRETTAIAISRYCGKEECLLANFDRLLRSSNITVRPEHIAVLTSNITTNADGNPMLVLYVQLDSSTVISSNSIEMAIEAARNLYERAGLYPDTNECATSNGGCSQNCINTIGSFECSCRTGYTLASNNVTCNDINECGIGNGGCSHTCNNSDGSFICSCSSGYTLASDAKTCDDINECLTKNGGCSHMCTNQDGSFECSCNSGYTLRSDNHTCIDLNECLTSNGGCSHVCTNRDGSFECSCNSGYSLHTDNQTCIDFNECLSNNGGCSHVCTNQDGSFACSCNSGYTLHSDNQACIDINECLTNNGGCNHICTNQDGTFECSCNSGYTLHSHNLTTCIDINECASDNGGCDQICTNTDGSFQCSCTAGFKQFNNGRTCLQGPCARAGFIPGCCTGVCNVNACYCDRNCHRYGDCCSDVPPLSKIACD